MLLHNNISSRISPTAFFRDFSRSSFYNFPSNIFGCFLKSFWDFQKFFLEFLQIFLLSRKSFSELSRNCFLGLLHKNLLWSLQKIFLKSMITFYFLKFFSKRNLLRNTRRHHCWRNSRKIFRRNPWRNILRDPGRIWGWPSWAISKEIFEGIPENIPE